MILLILIVGLAYRFDDLKIWHKYKRAFYFKGAPLFTCYDAFYFGRYAKEFLEGRYKAGSVDTLRFVPDSIIDERKPTKRPFPIPLISLLGAILTKLSGEKHVEKTAIWMTPALAVLFVVPLFLFMQRLGLVFSGFLGGLLGVVAQIYVVRTSIGRFDTDSLNLFFPFAIAFFLLLYIQEESEKHRLFWIAASILLCQLYWWWYFHPGLILVLTLSFLAALAINKGLKAFLERKKEIFLFLFFNSYILFKGIWGLFSHIWTYVINYFSPSVPTGFPNILKSISEARHFDFETVSLIVAGNKVLFIAGFLMSLLLFARHFRFMVLLLMPFLVGLMVLFGGNRFGMYLAPFVGMGLGYIIDLLAGIYKEKLDRPILRLAPLSAALVMAGVILKFNTASLEFTAVPKAWPSLTRDFLKLKEITPKNAWIWTWWDYGYAIEYLSERATYHDGGSQNTPKTYFVAKSFSTDRPEVAYNIIAGITKRGIVEIRRLEEEKKLNPKVSKKIAEEISSGKWAEAVERPVFWVFTEDLVGKFSWINYFGTWSFDKLKGSKKGILKLGRCFAVREDLLKCEKGYDVDLSRGLLVSGAKAFIVKRAYIVKSKIVQYSYREKGVILEIVFKNGVWGFVMNEQPFRSMFNQMYILRSYDPKYFELVLDDFPTMVVYKVLERKKSIPPHSPEPRS